MATRKKPKESQQVRKLRDALAREKAKSAALANERLEAREQQAAAAEILKVISRSTDSAQPVFDAIVKRARRLLGGHSAVLTQFADGVFHLAALTSTSRSGDASVRQSYPRPLASHPRLARVIRLRAPYVIRDIEKVSAKFVLSREMGRTRGYRSVIAVPLLRDREAIGTISVTRKEPGPFSKHEIGLLETFAKQAVIAIENVRRFNETKEALERQTATAEILKVIANSPSDVTPVFQAILKSATGLCSAERGLVFRYDGEILQCVAGQGLSAEARAEFFSHPVRPTPMSGVGHAVTTKKPYQVADITDDEAYRRGDPLRVRTARLLGARTAMWLPLLKDDAVIGTFAIYRKEVRPFTEQQIALVQTFANQAVIAIENARLFNETKEALQRQTAAAEILRVISSTPTNIQPVLDAVAERAARLCEAHDAFIQLREGDLLRHSAHFGPMPARTQGGGTLPIEKGLVAGRAILEKRQIHLNDLSAETEEYPVGAALAREMGYRTILVTPLIRQEEAIGTIVIRRNEVRPFGDKQMELVRTFADQAVIAIENVRLFNETKESLEQQTAISEVLRVISNSPADVRPVLEAVASRAAKICDATDARIFLAEGDRVRHAAGFGDLPVVREEVPLTAASVIGRAIISRAPAYIRDIADPSSREYAFSREVAAQAGWRSNLSVPLMREERALGAISLRRKDVRPFTEKQIGILQTFADQAAIAIENVRLFNETREALERQTATAEILKVIASSPSDVQPVFEAIAERAAALCAAEFGFVARYDGDLIHHGASVGPSPEALALHRSGYPMKPGAGSVTARVVLRGAPVQIEDMLADPEYEQKGAAEMGSFRSGMGVPMTRDGQVTGAIVVVRKAPGKHSEKQIGLLQTFADQAVIAIENARLFNETKEALERQTATAEILKVIASSPADVQPVFDVIARSAVSLLGGFSAAVTRIVDGFIHLLSFTSIGGREDEALKRNFPQPVEHSPGVHARAARAGLPVIVTDTLAEGVPPDLREVSKARNFRSIIAVPMIREGAVIGTISVPRREPGPFSDHHVELLRTFADQAVIAVENVRLFNETTEALERQTATSDILKVIASSPSDVQPVFDAILDSATRLCAGHFGILGLYDGANYKYVAHRGSNEKFAQWVLEQGRYEPQAKGGIFRMTAEQRAIHIADVREADAYREGNPVTVALADIGGVRTYLSVPMIKDDLVIGGITIYRPEVRPFSDKQIELVTTFASQAVIAIENVRLFNETKEALERQTATAEILKVIASSPSDVQPVFDAIVQSGKRLFDRRVVLRLAEGGQLHRRALSDPEMASLQGTEVTPIDRDNLVGRTVLEGRPMQVIDTRAPDAPPWAQKHAHTWNFRSNAAAPLLRDGKAIGVISMNSPEPGAMSQKQMELLATFADQAVIAIENVRLFNETKEALERQTATAEVLRAISTSPTDTRPVFDAILERAAKLCGADSGILFRYADGAFHALATRVPNPEFAALFQTPRRPSPGSKSGLAQLLARKSVVHIPDMLNDAAMHERDPLRLQTVRGGMRSWLGVPLLKEGEVTGAIVIYRGEPVPFSPSQIALLETFAEQSVIAIENVRLFNETKEALERQTATAEVLKVISGSLTDTQPVFNIIAERAARLTGATYGWVFTFDGALIHVASVIGLNAEGIDAARKLFPMRPSGASYTARAIRDGETLNIADALAETDPEYATKSIAAVGGYRSVLAVPMFRERQVVGAISVNRAEAGRFSEKEVELLKTFADQAVIAIENVRLFNETKEALERQTATAEILKVISGSPTDVQPVFEAIASSAMRLIGGFAAAVVRIIEGNLHLAAYTSTNAAGDEALVKSFPRPVQGAEGLAAPVIRSGKPFVVRDLETDPNIDPGARERARARGYRSSIGVPLVREEAVIGMINVTRREPGDFSPHHVDLLRTFADQAVIAIENVRLFNETKEALEQQTAISEILRVMSDSPSDVRPVLDAVAERALQICGSADARIFVIEGEELSYATGRGEVESVGYGFKRPISRGSVMGRAVIDKTPVHVEDLAAVSEAEFPLGREIQRQFGHRTTLGVPLLREGQALGVIVLRRKEVRPFTEKQIALLKTFADQAAIAIENVRLFNETKEALERQTAISEVLRVISSSPSDVQPVLEAVAVRAAKICDASDARIALVEGDQFRHAAGFGDIPPTRLLFPLERGAPIGRAVIDRATVYIRDIQAETGDDFALAREIAAQSGWRSNLVVPLMRKDTAVGAIALRRRDVRPFTQKQISLLQTFADQAAIAIENVRLFNETKESLDRQTATGEILKVISSSPTDVQPVFDAIVQNGARLVAPCTFAINMLEGDQIHARAAAGPALTERSWGELLKLFPLPYDPAAHLASRAIAERRVIEMPDTEAPGISERAGVLGRAGNYRSITFIPLIRDAQGIGIIAVTHPDRGFRLPEKQISLLKSFADQAVIAIENVRLFKELETRTEALGKSVEKLTALGEVGQAISSTLDLEKVLKTIATRAVRLTGLDGASIYEYDEQTEEFRLQAADNFAEEFLQSIRAAPIRKGDGTVGGVAITLEPIQVSDILDQSYRSSRKELLVAAGYRAILTVPLLLEGRIIGALNVNRKAPGTFAEEIVELMKTFATQSAMAIQNARLFREIEEKGKQLEEASKHKSQFLASMSHELRTPLNAILGFNEMILGDVYGEVPPDMKEPLRDIQTSGKHLLRLINNVLDLAKIEAGRMELAIDEYSVHDTVEGVRSTLRPLAEAKGLELAVNVPPDIPLARGDGGRITQCLMNLAGNSLKFTKQGSVGISVALTNGTLTYKVQDTGIGIPADKIGSLFTEFKQTDATIASEYGGTGLGLSITKKFIEMHGGRIWAESEPGSGSTFIFEVPLRADEARGA